MTTYGYFDDRQREYVITNPKTPVKWINYIGTLDFGGFVDHTGGLLVCRGDPALNRITKYIPQLPSSDFKGSTIYFRIKQGDSYQVFSPFFVPTLNAYDRYECHVGLGYSRFITEFYGIRVDITVFVPVGERCVLQDIKVSNLTGTPQEVDVIPVVEYTHFDALKQFTNADWIPQTMQSQVIEQDSDRKVLVQYPFLNRGIQENYFTSNAPVSSFDTDRKVFLGQNEYGTWASPFSLQQAELNNSIALRGDNMAALMHHLGTLSPNESSRIIVQLGQVTHVADELPAIEKYRSPGAVEAALVSMAEFWDEYLSKMQVNTPDDSMNQMINVHNARQCYITKNWSRYLSLYQLGLGARGLGFRDSSQDVLGILGSVPEEGKGLIRKLLHVQKRNGSAMHQFNPLTMIANEGDSREEEDRPHYYGDDHLWIVQSICAYLKETGDLAFLQEEIPYYEKDKKDKPIELGTVLDHLQRAIEFTHNDAGAHGLPHVGFADWNDTVNLPTGAESLINANLYGVALREMIELATHLGDSAAAQKYTAYYDEMKQRVNEHAWDGNWYVRYFEAGGTPLGSHTNQYGQIFANGQSWAVISGFAPPDRARQALESVFERLNTKYGIKLSTPGFNGYDPGKGGVTTYPPGAKENGGIFLHSNPWVMIAETMVGNGDRAFAYYNQINPAAQNERIDEFECEPYVYPQNILADEHPQFGLARNSWLSGTASWTYQAGTKYILGIRPAYTGLIIDPCIPHAWDGFKATRHFRGIRYEIEVQNPDHICKGVKSLHVDGQPVVGNVVPIFVDGEIHQVQIVLG